MRRLFTIRHSIFSRIVLLAILSAATTTCALWVLTDTTIHRSNRLALERAVDVDLAGMVDIYSSGGLDELTRRIGDRLALQPRNDRPSHYLVTDARGKRLAGDLHQWPGLHASLSEAGPITLDSGEWAFARATRLGPDVRLLVAHEPRDMRVLRRQIGLVFLAGGLLAIIVVTFAGLIAARRLAGRIDQINAAFRKPDASALDALTRDSPDQDEIDELTRHSGEALARLKRLAAAQRETTDHVAHEIRTPLMYLDNRLMKVLGGSPDPEIAGSIAVARAEITGIIRMLESLLDIAASEARRGDRHGLAPVDLSALAARLCELYADSAEESGHNFQSWIEPGIVIQGEEMALTRLITNLLDNAFKFVPSGGTIWLQLIKGPVLVIRDDGPGIPDGQRELIFEKFGRADGCIGEQGAGLGLALCRAIAARHRLDISLAPSAAGACFVVAPEQRP